ncbi:MULTISPECIES: DMT family transporter [unclassified Microbulbifer]|uniref:DMT family transporter n=1 Tax=unclassified Microbulbifer TaxID=2619833 RepID=UPI0027E3D255|nr:MULTISPECIES: DMT family transporter [unclassified Microbulbifer]
MNLFLYASTVLLWGTTWIAIHFQMGEVPVLVSAFYRFAIAGLLFLPALMLLRGVQKTTLRDHGFFVLQGGCLFSLNFICFYTASQYIVSGLISVVFSAAVLFNALNSRLLWGERAERGVYLAAALGIAGLISLFWDSIAGGNFDRTAALGLGLSVLGTYFFSLGNMVSVRHARRGLKPWTCNAYAMNYGALILLACIVASGTPWKLDTSPLYLGSLLYLAVPGSILGFTAYLSLVGRIGANRAAYATVLFPIVALSFSAWFEGYQWTALSFGGLFLVLLGNTVSLGGLRVIGQWRLRFEREKIPL